MARHGPRRSRVKYKDRYYCNKFLHNMVQKYSICKLEYNDLCEGCPHKVQNQVAES